jgi:hypothetical protein
MVFLKYVIFVRDDHCDGLPQAQKTWLYHCLPISILFKKDKNNGLHEVLHRFIIRRHDCSL